jgi:hypothetical protein
MFYFGFGGFGGFQPPPRIVEAWATIGLAATLRSMVIAGGVTTANRPHCARNRRRASAVFSDVGRSLFMGGSYRTL